MSADEKQSKRCDWCGAFVRADTPPWTFLNYHGDPTTQMHCPGCRVHANGLLTRNLTADRSWKWVTA